jgi:hypothetical protein
VKVPVAISGPSARTGLTAPPVEAPPISTAAVRAKPIDVLATAGATRLSVATAITTNTRRKVMNASTTNARPSLTPAAGTVRPSLPLALADLAESDPRSERPKHRPDRLGDDIGGNVTPREPPGHRQPERDRQAVGGLPAMVFPVAAADAVAVPV